MREDSRKRLAGSRRSTTRPPQAQEKVLDELLELVEVPVPEKLLEEEVKTRKHNLEHHQLGQMGLDLAKYLEIQGKTEEEFDAETKEQAEKGIKTQFVLDELVGTEKLNVSQEELTEHLMRRAQSSGMSPDQFAQAVVEGGQVPMLVGEVARGKALAVVVEAATVKDSNGEVVDLDDEDEDEVAETVAAGAEAPAGCREAAEEARTASAADGPPRPPPGARRAAGSLPPDAERRGRRSRRPHVDTRRRTPRRSRQRMAPPAAQAAPSRPRTRQGPRAVADRVPRRPALTANSPQSGMAPPAAR